MSTIVIYQLSVFILTLITLYYIRRYISINRFMHQETKRRVLYLEEVKKSIDKTSNDQKSINIMTNKVLNNYTDIINTMYIELKNNNIETENILPYDVYKQIVQMKWGDYETDRDIYIDDTSGQVSKIVNSSSNSIKPELTLDNILDKINKYGKTALSESEIDFLTKYNQ